MVYVFVVPFVVLVFLFFFLSASLKKKKKLQAASVYGKDTFDVELPKNTDIRSYAREFSLPLVTVSSAAEVFFMLVTPYFGSLPSKKRIALKKEIEKLSGDLKIDKNIYRFFMNEAEKYEGLNDDEASDKWRGQ